METDKLRNNKIAIIGAGHMGKALIQGLLHSGFQEKNLFISDTAKDNKNATQQAEWIILAVKPGQVQSVLQDLGEDIHQKLIISAAAALTIGKITSYTKNPKQKVLRIMPNLPVAYNQGVIGIFTNAAVSNAEKEEVTALLSGIGTIIECDKEEDLDVITVLSGSGPAVAAYCISMLSKSGESFGLPKKIAEEIAVQTFRGTTDYLQITNQTALDLQTAVATKGGVTEQIINQLDTKKLPELFGESLGVGYDKIKKIKEEL